jgi:cation diffusion facilitator family transporter
MGVMLGLVLIKILDWHILDPIISITLALYIFYIGIMLSAKSVNDIVDRSLDQEDIDFIVKTINKYKKHTHDYHKLATRKSGSTKIIEFHLQFDGTVNLSYAHSEAKKIEHEIKDHFVDSRVIIHVEPCKADCDKCTVDDCDSRLIK